MKMVDEFARKPDIYREKVLKKEWLSEDREGRIRKSLKVFSTLCSVLNSYAM